MTVSKMTAATLANGAGVTGRHDCIQSASAEEDPMHADRRDQQHGRAERTSDRDEVDGRHRAGERGEALLERDGEQETGEQRDACLRHSQLLQQTRPIAVQPLGFRLVAIRIPPVVRVWVLHVHDANSDRRPRVHGLIDGFSLPRSAAA